MYIYVYIFLIIHLYQDSQDKDLWIFCSQSYILCKSFSLSSPKANTTSRLAAWFVPFSRGWLSWNCGPIRQMQSESSKWWVWGLGTLLKLSCRFSPDGMKLLGQGHCLGFKKEETLSKSRWKLSTSDHSGQEKHRAISTASSFCYLSKDVGNGLSQIKGAAAIWGRAKAPLPNNGSSPSQQPGGQQDQDSQQLIMDLKDAYQLSKLNCL